MQIKLLSINFPYEKMYHEIARRFFEGIQQSNYHRDERAAIVIMSQLSLEVFINRIGIEILAEKEPNFDIKKSLESDSFLNKFSLYTEKITGKSFDKSGKIWFDLKELNKDRNQLIHAKPYTIDFQQGGQAPLFFNDNKKLKRRFDTVSNTVKYLINNLGIPSYPTKPNTRVYDYTDKNVQAPPIGKTG